MKKILPLVLQSLKKNNFYLLILSKIKSSKINREYPNIALIIPIRKNFFSYQF